jgi:hypothetical protein
VKSKVQKKVKALKKMIVIYDYYYKRRFGFFQKGIRISSCARTDLKKKIEFTLTRESFYFRFLFRHEKIV